jgi:hypothetical protein
MEVSGGRAADGTHAHHFFRERRSKHNYDRRHSVATAVLSLFLHHENQSTREEESRVEKSAQYQNGVERFFLDFLK